MQAAGTSALTQDSVGPLMPLLLRHESQQPAVVLVQLAVSRQLIIASHGAWRDI